MKEKSNTPTEHPKPDPAYVPAMHDGEIDAIAYRLAKARTDYIEHFQRYGGLSREEAITRADQDVVSDEERRAELAAAPAREVQWYELNRVMEFDEAAGLAKWEQVKQQARHELEGGQRSLAVMGYDNPWEWAQYAALVNSFREEWRPRGGMERALLEQMAQTYSEWMEWLGRTEEWEVHLTDHASHPIEHARCTIAR